ncbi:MAG: sigma-70 family RNA polymerase sigma factor [Deltaproteobacteria bacterium]|nr:sigma-70 family RNA polymerase sigma factor [Deltaproteobacteria bacterium]
MTERTEAALLEAARTGDRAALEVLLERYQARIYRFGLRLCGDRSDAEDVVQETMLAMAKELSSFRGDASLSTWIYSIARSYCARRRRKKPLESDLGALDADAPEVQDPSPNAERIAEDRELEVALEEAIARLPGADREVLVLRDVEGLTAPEVAKVVGLSVDAVKSRLHRARLKVRARLAPLLEIPNPGPLPSCPDVLSLFSRHVEGEISAQVCAEMEHHLAGCPRCEGACSSLKRTLSLCAASPVPQVPPEVQARIRSAVRRLS